MHPILQGLVNDGTVSQEDAELIMLHPDVLAALVAEPQNYQWCVDEARRLSGV